MSDRASDGDANEKTEMRDEEGRWRERALGWGPFPGFSLEGS